MEWVEVLASGIGMTGPIVLAAAMGRLPLGLMAAVGAMAVSGVGPGASTRAQVQGLALAFSAAVLAAIAAALVAGHGALTDVMVVLIACVAATLGGYSRPMVGAAMRFVLFLVIGVNVASVIQSPAWLPFLMVAGALWTALVSVLIGLVWRLHRPIEAGENNAARSSARAAQKVARFKQSLTHLSGWNYTLRLGLGLGIALGLQWLWPEHHLYWISVTVAILTRRRLEAFPIKTTQRAIGTAVGVVVASLLLALQMPVWGLILAIGLLALARPVLKSRNYLAYSVAMTPLIILIMDAGQPLEAGVLLDRLVATVLGAALVLAANRIFRTLVTPRDSVEKP